MNPIELLYKHHWNFPKEDEDFWNTSTAGMPSTFAPGTPFSCGPHSLRSMSLFVGWAKPKTMLEIGFNVGHSACIWLTLGVEKLYSAELRDSPEVHTAMIAVKRRFPGRFSIHMGDSGELRPGNGVPTPIDAAFVDGDHSYRGIVRDIATCRAFGIRKLLLDDVFVHNPETMEAIQKTGLQIVFISGNQIACVDP